jgi:peptide-methionine (S)-S-oxide reductase
MNIKLLTRMAMSTAATLLMLACHTNAPQQPITTSTTNMDTNTTTSNPSDLQVATLGGGCFWCVEVLYQELKGVTKVESGYAGGTVDNPTYKDICTGLTGHAEVVKITFDSTKIKYRDIVDIFFTVHDPTTLNRQGNDVGTQYRSVIFYHSDAQKAEAEAAKVKAATIWDAPIVTEISAAPTFYKAEQYHQNYYNDNPYQGYCQVIIAPKVKKFRQQYAERLKQ